MTTMDDRAPVSHDHGVDPPVVTTVGKKDISGVSVDSKKPMNVVGMNHSRETNCPGSGPPTFCVSYN